MRYRFAGKENMLSLGNYPDCTLKEARDKRDCTRKKISDGIDPSQEKKIAKLTRHINAENSFENVAREWHEAQKLGCTERRASYVLQRIEADIFSSIGFRPINEVTAPELLATVRVVEKRGALDIAHRVLQTSGQIFRYAIATGRATHDISAALRGALQPRKKKHFNLSLVNSPQLAAVPYNLLFFRGWPIGSIPRSLLRGSHFLLSYRKKSFQNSYKSWKDTTGSMMVTSK